MNATSWLQGLRTQEGLRALGVRAPRYVSFALALALGVQAAVIVTDFAAAPRKSAALGPGPALVAARGARGGFDIGGLVNAHLFGSAATPGASGADAAHAPATNLSLVLAGVLAAEDPAGGMAILGEAAARAKVYMVGQSVPGGAKLHAVYDDRVILERNGALESLLLPHGAGTPGRASPPVLAAAPAANPLETMRRVISDNPAVVGEILRPTPVFVNGKQQGFRLYPGRNRAAFSHLGLQAGDLVTAVNGTPLDDPGRGNEILGTLSSATEAHVTITRNGRSQDLVLNLAQVANDAEQIGAAGPRGADAPAAPAAPVAAADGALTTGGSTDPAAAGAATGTPPSPGETSALAPGSPPAPAPPAAASGNDR